MNQEYVYLRDVSELITKGTTPTTLGFDFTDEGIRFLRVQNIEGGQVHFNQETLHIDEKTHHVLKRSQIKPGDVLVSIAGSIGRSAVVPENAPELNCNQAVAIVRTKNDVLQPYLRHWLESFDAQSQMRGSTVTGTISNLSLTQLGSLKVPLPPIAQQKRIAAILDQAEELRSLRRQALGALDAIAQSIFLEMFGDPTTNPKGWKTSQLRKVCDEINDCPHSTPAWTDYGVVCLRTSNLTEGSWNWEDTRFVSIETYHERSKRGYILAGDIILSREGTVGVAAIVTPEMKVCMGQRLVQLRPSASILTSEFALQHLLYVLSPIRLSRLMVGSTSQHLNVKELKELKVPLPPLPLQQEFARRIEAIEQLKATHRESLAHLDALFASLQHRAFRGEL